MSLPDALRTLDRELARANRQRIREVFEQPEMEHACRDCGEVSARRGVPGHALGLREEVIWYCDPCWRWREHRGLEFDPRRRAEMPADGDEAA